jgi:hypothetical protein
MKGELKMGREMATVIIDTRMEINLQENGRMMRK